MHILKVKFKGPDGCRVANVPQREMPLGKHMFAERRKICAQNDAEVQKVVMTFLFHGYHLIDTWLISHLVDRPLAEVYFSDATRSTANDRSRVDSL